MDENVSKWEEILKDITFRIPVCSPDELKKQVKKDLECRISNKKDVGFYDMCSSEAERKFEALCDAAGDSLEDVEEDFKAVINKSVNDDPIKMELILSETGEIAQHKLLKNFSKLSNVNKTGDKAYKISAFILNRIRAECECGQNIDYINVNYIHSLCKQYLSTLKYLISQIDNTKVANREGYANGIIQIFNNDTSLILTKADLIIGDNNTEIDNDSITKSAYSSKVFGLKEKFLHEHPEFKEIDEQFKEVDPDYIDRYQDIYYSPDFAESDLREGRLFSPPSYMKYYVPDEVYKKWGYPTQMERLIANAKENPAQNIDTPDEGLDEI